MEKMQKKMPGLEPRDVLIRLCVGVFSKVTSSSSSQRRRQLRVGEVTSRSSLKIAGRIQVILTYRTVMLDDKI